MPLHLPLSVSKLGFKTLFFREYNRADEMDLVNPICEVEPSDTQTEKYYYPDEAPAMQEVVDQFLELGFGELQYSITNKKFGAVVTVKQDDLDDDQVGGLRQTVRSMAFAARRHPNQLVIDALINGEATLGYDGVAFFSGSHPARGKGAAGDNIMAGAGSTTANLQTDINKAITEMAKFESNNGQLFHTSLNQFVIMAPMNLRQPILEALRAEEIGNTTNVLFRDKQITPYFDARFDADDANDWYLLHVGGGNKPLIYQSRRPTRVEEQRTGDRAFFHEEYAMKVSARRAVGYANWRNAIKVTNT